jgi:flagellar hook-associated protein 1 FlgK
MPNLFDSIRTAGQALGVYQRALEVVQNNVTNSTTSGYARQRLQIDSRSFDLATGMAGGVADRGLDSARNEYAEDEVRRQLHLLGFAEAKVQMSGSIERLFDVSGDVGIPGALTQLFRAFSAWSAAPSDLNARSSVIDAAGVLATRIRGQAASLSDTEKQVRDQIGSTADRINELAAVIQNANHVRREQQVGDPGLDARVHSAMEELAELVDFSAVAQADGTVTVVLSGGAPLVVGEQQYKIQAGRDDAGADAVFDWEGRDVTDQAAGGRLGALLDTARHTIPETKASFDSFALALASTVNGILTSGTVAPGSSVSGAPLFAIDVTQGARTLKVDPSISAGDLAPVDASGNANGNALKLASLATSNAGGGVNALTFGEYLGAMAAEAGRQSATAQHEVESQRDVAGQARSLRDSLSGVSLDEEAVLLMQFQRSYQATARLITTLNDMTGEILGMVR